MSLWHRLANVWRRERLDAEIDEELQSHLAMAAEDAERAGMAPAEARRVARLRFGNPLEIRERTADADSSPLLDALWRDVVYAARQLWRSPVFTATAVLTLALGIGATTAVFTLVDQVLLRTLPVAHPERLWLVGDGTRCCHRNGYAPGDWSFFSGDAYERLRADRSGFEELAALQVGQAELGVRRAGSPASAEPRTGEYVSGNFFATLEVRPWRGRMLVDADDRPGAAPVAVLSYRVWRDAYGADPAVIGGSYDVNGHPFTIVGVAPPAFYGAKVAAGGMPDLWLPLATEPLIDGPTARLTNPALGWLALIGRAGEGASAAPIESHLRVALRQWLASHAAEMTPAERAARDAQTLRLTPGGAGVSLLGATYGESLRQLLAAAACVLLVACANIANLLLARGARDRHQTALRAALGASRGRLLRKALVESAVLGAMGAAAGVVVAFGGARLILRLAFADDGWVPVDATPSFGALSFAVGCAAASALAFGSAPAWLASRADPLDALQGAHRTVGRRRRWGRRSLVAVQAALSVVLLSAAVMLGASLRNLEHRDIGFEPDERWLVSINSMLDRVDDDRIVNVVRDAEERLRAIPGVRAANAVLYAPMSGYSWDRPVHVEGARDPASSDDESSEWTRVTPGFFATMGDRIVAGRPIRNDDDAGGRPVAVVNETFAKRFFAGANPIGRRFGPVAGAAASTYEIVGVAADVRYFADVRDPHRPMYFVPEAQRTRFDDRDLEGREIWSHYPYSVVVWAPRPPADFEARVRDALRGADAGIVVYGLARYTAVIDAAFSQQRMIASLTWLFGAIALVLAAVGLYGVTAHDVEQRTGEIGVRMALGADRWSVLGDVVRDAFVPVAIGLAVGVPAAVGAGRVLASRLFGVAPWDVPTLLGAALLLGAASMLAALGPALRAMAVSPMAALRAE